LARGFPEKKMIFIRTDTRRGSPSFPKNGRPPFLFLRANMLRISVEGRRLDNGGETAPTANPGILCVKIHRKILPGGLSRY
jgi:hypothetical protein